MQTKPAERYHGFSGIGRGMLLRRHGKLTSEFQLRPTIVPASVSGNEMKTQMSTIATIVLKGMAEREE